MLARDLPLEITSVVAAARHVKETKAQRDVALSAYLLPVRNPAAGVVFLLAAWPLTACTRASGATCEDFVDLSAELAETTEMNDEYWEIRSKLDEAEADCNS